MLFIVYFFSKMKAIFTPHMNFFLLETSRSTMTNLSSLCNFSLFFSSFETENVSRSDSSRVWIPILRAQEKCLITKYLVDSSCEGWYKLSFGGINQRVRAVRHISAWIAEALCWAPLQRKAENSAQVGSVWSSWWRGIEAHPFERALASFPERYVRIVKNFIEVVNKEKLQNGHVSLLLAAFP